MITFYLRLMSARCGFGMGIIMPGIFVAGDHQCRFIRGVRVFSRVVLGFECDALACQSVVVFKGTFAVNTHFLNIGIRTGRL